MYFGSDNICGDMSYKNLEDIGVTKVKPVCPIIGITLKAQDKRITIWELIELELDILFR